MKRGLRRLLMGLLLLGGLLMGAGWLLGTTSGVTQLLQLANRWLPGTLTVKKVQGDLLGNLQLEGVSFVDPGMEIGIGRLVLRWRPRDLLQGRLSIRDLVMDGVRYLGRGRNESESASMTLPALKLPLAIELQSASVHRLEVITTPGAEPLRLDQMTLVGGWRESGITLSRLALQLPQVTLNAEGRLQPQGNYPLELSLQWQVHSSDLPRMKGTGRVYGDLLALQVEQRVTGDVMLWLKGRVDSLLQQPGWQGEAVVSRLPEAYLPKGVPAGLQLQAKGKGDLDRASLQLQATTSDDHPARLGLTGHLTFSTRAFELQGKWQELRWPLTGAPGMLSKQGRLEASGRPQAYRFQLQADLTAPALPPGQWKLQGHGDLAGVQVERLHGDLLGGAVTASGRLGWKQGITWRLATEAKDLDPGAWQPRLSGRLDAALATHGSFRQGAVNAELVLERLSGELNGQPVAGKGKVQLAGDEIQVEELTLTSGEARLQAHGRLDRQWRMQWQLAVPELAALSPGSRGSLAGEGRLTGTAAHPRVQGNLKVTGLAHAGMALGRADASFDLRLDPRQRSMLKITADVLRWPGGSLPGLQLALSGPMDDQHITLALQHAEARLQLEARGRLALQPASWSGHLRRLSVEGERLGHWRLQQPASLWLSARRFALGQLCLADGSARACARIDKRAGKGQATLALENLGLERLRFLLPPEILQLTGSLALHAQADLSEPLTATLEARLSPGRLAFLDARGHRALLDHRNGRVSAVYDARRLAADWNIELGEHSASGELDIPRSALQRAPRSAPLRGRLRLEMKDLDLVRLFVPELQEIEGGRAHADLRLAGTLGEPKLGGEARVIASRLVVPRLGVTLRDAEVRLTGDGGDRLHLAGRVRSGQGRMRLSGTLELAPGRGWPTRLTLEGDDFQLADIPEARVVANTRLELEQSVSMLRVRGRVELPKAELRIEDIPPGTVAASPDVVVQGQEEKRQATPARLDARVELILGDQVHFAGFGLDADLAGKLTITQLPGQSPRANGELLIESGSFRAYGQNLTIERGRLSWSGGALDDPLLHLQASRRVDDIVVGLRVAGSLKHPDFTLYSSDSTMTEKEMVALLLTGQKGSDITKASIYAGRQITPRLSVGVNLGGGDRGTEFVARYRLMDHVELEGTSSARKSGASINYTFDVK